MNNRHGVTLIELLVAISIMGILINVAYALFDFGNKSNSISIKQQDIQSSIRLASDIIVNKTRYASHLEIWDPSTPLDSSYNHIYQSSGNLMIKEMGSSATKIVNSDANTTYSILFTLGDTTGHGIRYNNQVNFINSNLDNILEYDIDGVKSGREYSVETEVNILNLNVSVPNINPVEGVVATPPEGVVPFGTLVTLTGPVGATIYYTNDSSIPTTSSILYTSAIPITENMTIKAIAVKDGIVSEVAIYDYTYSTNRAPIVAPNFLITGGTREGDILVVVYAYSDPDLETDQQGKSIIRWYSSSDNKGYETSDHLLQSLTIDQEGSTIYTINANDKGFYIYVVVTPIQVLDDLQGVEAQSQYFGKIKQN